MFITNAWERIPEVDYSCWVVFLVLWFISGQTYNYIRGTPFAYENRHGLVLIAQDFGEQTVAESNLIIILYGLIVYSIIQLIQLMQKEEENGDRIKLGSIKNRNKKNATLIPKENKVQKFKINCAIFAFSFLGLMQLAKYKS